MADPITAHLYDGTTLNFPAGTDPAVIQATVKKETERRRNQTGAQGLWEGINRGAGKTATSLYKGIADVIGTPQAVVDIFRAIPEAILGPAPPTGPSLLPRSEDVQRGMEYIGLLGPEFENQLLASGIRAIPGALGGPGSIPAKVATGFAAGAGSEAAGQLAEGTPYETWARAGGALVGGLGGQKAAGVVEKTIGKAQIGPFAQLGIDPKLATQVRPNSTGLKWWQNAISNMPGGFDRMQSAAQGAIDDVAKAVESRAAQLGSAATKQEAGASLQKGGANWLNQFELDETRKWNEFFSAMPSNTPVHLAHTKAALGNVQKAMPDMPATERELLGAKLKSLQDAVVADLQKNALGGAVDSASLESVKNMRSIIGNIIKEPPLMNDMTRGKWAELYAALTEDIKESALRVGSATGRFDALDKFKAANDFTRDGHQFVANSLSKILTKTGGITPEQAATFVMSESRKGATQIAALRSKLTPAEWEDFSSYVVRSLGRSGTQTAAGDAFSPAMFLANYQKLDPAARAILFKGTGLDLSSDMAAVATIAEGMRDTAKLANSSRTAGTSILLEMLGAGAGASTGSFEAAMVGVAAPYISGQAASRLMTNRQFIRWLATPTSLEGLPTHLRRLAVIAQTSPITAPAIAEYLTAVKTATQPQALPESQSQLPSTSAIPQVTPGFNNVSP